MLLLLRLLYFVFGVMVLAPPQGQGPGFKPEGARTSTSCHSNSCSWMATIALTRSPCVRFAGKRAVASRMRAAMTGSGLIAVMGTPLQFTYPSNAASVH
jgi:hypothetical protein